MKPTKRVKKVARVDIMVPLGKSIIEIDVKMLKRIAKKLGYRVTPPRKE